MVAAQRLATLSMLDVQHISPMLLREYTAEQLSSANARLGLADLFGKMDSINVDVQRAVLAHEDFLPVMQDLLDGGMSADAIHRMMNTAECEGVLFFTLSAAQIQAIEELELSCSSDKWQFYRLFGDKGLETPSREILTRNIGYFQKVRGFRLNNLTDEQRALMWLPFLSKYVPAYPISVEAALPALASNPALQELMTLLHEKGVVLRESSEDWQGLRHVKQEHIAWMQQLLPLLSEKCLLNGTFMDRWAENGCVTHELQKLIRVLPNMDVDAQENLFTSQLTYLAGLYGKQLEGLELDALDHCQSHVLIYAITHKQTAFLKLVKAHFAQVKSLPDASMLFAPAFYERICLNSMTERDLRDCGKVLPDMLNLKWLADGVYTFKELKTLAYAPKQYADLYNRLLGEGVDQRLTVIRQLLKHRLLSDDLDDSQMDELAARLIEKPFDRWWAENLAHIEGLRREDAVRLLSCWSALARYAPDMRTGDEVCFAVRNRDAVSQYDRWANARSNMVSLDADWQRLCEEFDFSEEFLKRHEGGVLRFIAHEGAAIANTFLNWRKADHENLRKIVQAELMGRLPALKYHGDDLERELNLLLSSKQKDAWMKNTDLSHGEFTIREHDDFYTTMQIGEIPTHTCLSYRSGAQVNCLLSCFDANKKILMAYRNGVPVARSMIRLTKGGNFGDGQQDKLEFADLQGDSGQSAETVLFLECMYQSGLNDEDARKVSDLFIALLKEKAKTMGAGLVVSMSAVPSGTHKKPVPQGFVSSRYSIYISRSKAGNQYLDSLSGPNTVANEGSYRSGVFYLLAERSQAKAGKERK